MSVENVNESLDLNLKDMIFIDDDYKEIINNNDDFKRLEGIIINNEKNISGYFILMKYPSNAKEEEEEVYSISLIYEKYNKDNPYNIKISNLQVDKYIYHVNNKKIKYYKLEESKIQEYIHNLTLIIFKKLTINDDKISIDNVDIINIFYMTLFINDTNKYANLLFNKNITQVKSTDIDYRIDFHIKHRLDFTKIYFKEELKNKLNN
jgi:bifunctional DNase/RNase